MNDDPPGGAASSPEEPVVTLANRRGTPLGKRLAFFIDAGYRRILADGHELELTFSFHFRQMMCSAEGGRT